jgi:ABC-type transporter Mla MlaB component
VIRIEGALSDTDVVALCARLRAVLEAADVDVVTIDVGPLDRPDATTVDAVARLQLTARRHGRSIRLRHASRALTDLLELFGLHRVVSWRS